jgi:hypothetical protein
VFEAYYDSLTREEVDEQTRWGEFALGEFPKRGECADAVFASWPKR